MKWHLGLQLGNENLQTKHTYGIICSYVNMYTHMLIYLNLYTYHDSKLYMCICPECFLLEQNQQ